MKLLKLRTWVLGAVLLFALGAGAPAADVALSYHVRQGDGLDAIARRRHTSRATLLRLNPLLSPDLLDVGTVIKVPARNVPPRHQAMRAMPRARPASAEPAVAKPKPVVTAIRPTVAKPKPAVSAIKPTVAKPKPAVTAIKPTVAKSKPVVTIIKPTAATPNPAVATTQPEVVKAKPATPYADYKEPRKDDAEQPIGRIIVDLIWKLALVLAIAYLAIFALRGVMNRTTVLPGQKGRLKVLESAALGPNRAVHLVRVGSKILVLGSTPDQITAIGEVDDVDVAPVAASGPAAFAGHLAEAVAGEKGGALPEQFHGGIRHIWNSIQEIRDLRSRERKS